MKVLAEVMNNVYHSSITLSRSSFALCSLSCSAEYSEVVIIITSAKNVLIYVQGTLFCTGFKGDNGTGSGKVSGCKKKKCKTPKQCRHGVVSPCLLLPC